MTDVRTWKSFGECQEHEGAPFFSQISPWREAVRFSGVKDSDIKTLNLIEDPDGKYCGWLSPEDEGKISMVQHERVFPIQFPYGITAAIENGDGFAVKLRIEIVE